MPGQTAATQEPQSTTTKEEDATMAPEIEGLQEADQDLELSSSETSSETDTKAKKKRDPSPKMSHRQQEQMLKTIAKLKVKLSKNVEAMEAMKKMVKSREEKLKLRIIELKNKKHKRRSPGVKICKVEHVWIKALRRVADEDKTAFTIYPKGSQNYQRAVKYKHQILAECEDAKMTTSDSTPSPSTQTISVGATQ